MLLLKSQYLEFKPVGPYLKVVLVGGKFEGAYLENLALVLFWFYPTPLPTYIAYIAISNIIKSTLFTNYSISMLTNIQIFFLFKRYPFNQIITINKTSFIMSLYTNITVHKYSMFFSLTCEEQTCKSSRGKLVVESSLEEDNI